jgi:hypothetical protein
VIDKHLLFVSELPRNWYCCHVSVPRKGIWSSGDLSRCTGTPGPDISEIPSSSSQNRKLHSSIFPYLFFCLLFLTTAALCLLCGGLKYLSKFSLVLFFYRLHLGVLELHQHF